MFFLTTVFHGPSAGDHEENRKTHGSIIIKVSKATVSENDKEATWHWNMEWEWCERWRKERWKYERSSCNPKTLGVWFACGFNLVICLFISFTSVYLYFIPSALLQESRHIFRNSSPENQNWFLKGGKQRNFVALNLTNVFSKIFAGLTKVHPMKV